MLDPSYQPPADYAFTPRRSLAGPPEQATTPPPAPPPDDGSAWLLVLLLIGLFIYSTAKERQAYKARKLMRD